MRLLLPLALLGLFAPMPAVAQSWPDEQCIMEPTLASCAQSRADGLAMRFGVPRIEQHLADGDAVVRIFFINGDGRDRLLIAFVRAPGRDPTASVHFPRQRGQPSPPPMQAPIPQAVWDQALDRASYAERSLTPVPADPRICLHPWTYVFEASDPAREGYMLPAATRRHIVNGCEDAPLILFAGDLQRLALPLFPACDALASNQYWYPADQLFRCSILSGDRLAAARVVNLATAFERVRAPQDQDALADLFVDNATVDWNGRRTPRGADSDRFWLARVAEDGVDSFTIERAEGQSIDRVRITGRLGRSTHGREGPIRYSAPFEQMWVQNMIVSATVGAWTLQPDP